MSRPQFTPERWNVGLFEPRPETGEISEPALAVWSSTVKPSADGIPICLVSPVSSIDQNDRRNATLIAAAPALRDKLQELYAECTDKGFFSEDSEGAEEICALLHSLDQ